MRILAIDIGYHNMGIVIAECKGDPKVQIEFMKKISLEDYKYNRSNDFVDIVPLFIEDHAELFNSAERILIERQPPGGFQNIEILIHYMFKDKVQLVHPTSVHSHFNMRHLNYEERKERSTQIAERCIESEIELERKHDIADAICMLLYYNYKTFVLNPFDKFRFGDSPINYI